MRRARLAVLLALVMAAAVVAAALAFERDEPLGPPVRAAAAGEWRPLAPAGLERTEVAAARIGRSIYVVGGFEKRSGQTTAALERYDIRANRWKRLRSMPVGLNHATAAAYRGKLYVHGGYTGRRDLTSATARLFAYNPRTNRWARLPRSARPRAAHGLAVIGRRLFAFGGRNDSGAMRSMEVYNFKRRRWSAGPPMKGPARDHMAGVAAGDFIYALAGAQPRQLRHGRAVRPRAAPMAGAAVDAQAARRNRVGTAQRRARDRVRRRGVGRHHPRGRAVRAQAAPLALAARHADAAPRARRGVAERPRLLDPGRALIPGFHFSNAIEFLDVR